MDIVEVEKK